MVNDESPAFTFDAPVPAAHNGGLAMPPSSVIDTATDPDLGHTDPNRSDPLGHPPISGNE